MALSWNRIAAISGIIFVVLLIVGLMMASDFPDSSDPDADWLAYYGDDGRLIRNIIGAYMMVAAAIAFVVFFAVFFRNLRLASGDEVLPTITFITGIMFLTTLLGASLLAVVAANLKLGDSTTPTADFGRTLPAAGYVLFLIGGGFSAAAMIVSASIIVLRTRVMASWVAYLGFIAAIALLFAAVFIPMIALPIWVLVVSVALLRRSETASV